MFVRLLLAFWLGFSLLITGFVYADCPTPQYLSTYSITNQSASLNWSYYGSNPIGFQVQWRLTGATSWSAASSTIVTSPYGTSLTGLANNTVYDWRVRVICAAGDTSAYSASSVFQTRCQPPGSLSVYNLTDNAAQLYWSTMYSGLVTEVQWRAVGSATWNVLSGLTNNYLSLTGLTEETSYEWRVRSTCSSTDQSDFVTGPLFRTLCLAPSNARTSLVNPEAAELKWDTPFTGAVFDIQWRLAGTTSWNLVEGITSPEYALAGLANGAAYEWQVRTYCSATSKSAFTGIQLFQTSCPLPTNLNTNSISANTATLQWTSFASTLQWRPAGAASWNTIPTAQSPYSLTGLTNNTTYEWRVQTACSLTATSGYTASQLFTTACSGPGGMNVGTDGAGGLYVYWYAYDAGVFELQWRVSGTTNWSVVSGLSTSPYHVTGLSSATTYELRLRRACSATDYSNFITQLATPTCSIPYGLYSSQTSATAARLSWNQYDPGVFDVQWRPVGNPTWTTASNIRTTYYDLGGLTANVPYEWRVRQLCGASAGSDFSDSQSFTLDCGQPNTLYTANVTYTSVTAFWLGSTPIFPPYDLQYRLAGTTSWTTVSNLPTAQYTMTGLTTNATYEWRVRSTCSATSQADYSATQSFTTQCGVPAGWLSYYSLNYNSVSLAWQDAGTDIQYEIQYRLQGTTNWTSILPGSSETNPSYGTNTTSFVVKQYNLYNLKTNSTYEWRIRTVCAAGIYSNFVSGPTFTTACPTPYISDVHTERNSVISFQWYTASVAPNVEVWWRKVGSQVWNVESNITATTYKIADLAAGSTYEYQIRQVCEPGVFSDFSALGTLTIPCMTPNYVLGKVLSSTSLQIQWAYADYYSPTIDVSAKSYDVRYHVSGTDSWSLITGVTGNAYSLTGLTPGTTYGYMVRATCSEGVLSGFSSEGSVTLNCSAPYVNVNYTQVGTSMAILSLGAQSQYAQAYLFQWRKVGTTNWTTISLPSNSNGYLQTTVSLTGLANNTTYEWQVVADCGGGFLSDHSNVWSFATSCPSVYSLSTSKVGLNYAQLTWAGANLLPTTAFTVQYRIAGTVVWSTVTTSTTAVSVSGLTPNTSYEWRVRMQCEGENISAYSWLATFTTACPSITSFWTTNWGSTSAVVAWTNPDTTAQVNLWWRNAASNTWNQINGLTGSSYAFTGLQPSTTYTVSIQTVCPGNNVSQPVSSSFWTNYSSFQVVADTISATVALVDWSSGPDNVSYTLKWQEQNGAWKTTGPLSVKKYWLTGLSPYTLYNVQVSYTDNNGTIIQATNQLVTTCPKASYSYTSYVTATQAQLNWQGGGALSAVQWRIAGSQNWTTITGIASTSYALTGLANNTTYEWRVQTICSDGVTSATLPIIFRTSCTMPVQVLTVNAGPTSAKLWWNNAGTQYAVRYRIVGETTWTMVTGLTSATCVLTGLTPNTTYEWGVATNCDPGITTAFTGAIPFTTQCVSARYIGINGTPFPDWARIWWDGSGDSFTFQWRLQGTDAWNTVLNVTSPYTVTGLTPDAIYECRVLASCEGAAYSQIRTFPTSCYNSPIAYATKTTSSTARLFWQADNSYLETNVLTALSIRWRAMGERNWRVISTNLTSPYTLTGLASNTMYEWQLSTPCQPGYGPSQYFWTNCTMPINLQTSQLTNTSVLLNWNTTGETAGYELQWRLAGATAWNSIPNLTTTSYSLTGLTSDTSYEWQVRSQCGTAFEVIAAFKTLTDCAFSMVTVRTGAWNDPTVWACNRVPTATDRVQLNHVITVPAGYTAQALLIRYATAAQLTMGTGAKVALGTQ